MISAKNAQNRPLVWASDFFQDFSQVVSPEHSAIKQETSHSPNPPDIPEEIGQSYGFHIKKFNNKGLLSEGHEIISGIAPPKWSNPFLEYTMSSNKGGLK